MVRAATAEVELAQERARIGVGTSATVLFHEPSFDSAMIALEPGAEMSEANNTALEMLYFVSEAEDQQVEFKLASTGSAQRLSKGSEAVVPAGATYALRNASAAQTAKLLAVVPRLPS